MDIQMIKFQTHGDERGALIALEEYKNIPFEVKRVYFMYDTKPGVYRGMHAHKTLKQVLFCPRETKHDYRRPKTTYRTRKYQSYRDCEHSIWKKNPMCLRAEER